jgi:hypothetical protein
MKRGCVDAAAEATKNNMRREAATPCTNSFLINARASTASTETHTSIPRCARARRKTTLNHVHANTQRQRNTLMTTIA